MKLRAVAALSLLAACGKAPVRDVVNWTPAQINQALFPTQIVGPKPTAHLGIVTGAANADPVQVACATCHVAGAARRLASPDPPYEDRFRPHAALALRHGSLACASCHEGDNPALLHSASSETFGLADSMRLCAQCHGPVKTAYDHGAHGGMRGYWDLQRGPRERNECIACHDPHQPAYPLVVPAPGPNQRRAHPRQHPGSLVEQRYGSRSHE